MKILLPAMVLAGLFALFMREMRRSSLIIGHGLDKPPAKPKSESMQVWEGEGGALRGLVNAGEPRTLQVCNATFRVCVGHSPHAHATSSARKS